MSVDTPLGSVTNTQGYYVATINGQPAPDGPGAATPNGVDLGTNTFTVSG